MSDISNGRFIANGESTIIVPFAERLADTPGKSVHSSPRTRTRLATVPVSVLPNISRGHTPTASATASEVSPRNRLPDVTIAAKPPFSDAKSGWSIAFSRNEGVVTKRTLP